MSIRHTRAKNEYPRSLKAAGTLVLFSQTIKNRREHQRSRRCVKRSGSLHRQRITSSLLWILSPPLAEQLLGAEINKIPHTLVCGILVREAGLEPARPEWTLEPESSESANSTTRASAVFRLLRYIITDPPACQADFSFLRLFFAFFLPRNAALPRTPLHEPHISCREGTDNEPVRSRIHAHSVDLDEEISKIGSLLARTADFGRGTRT